jgi:adenylate cyclase
VAGVIEPTIQAEEIRHAVARRPADMAAHDYYLQAWALHRVYTKAATLRALELVTRAVDLDPHFAPALALAAVSHTLIHLYGWTDDLETNFELGVRMGRRAAIEGCDDAHALALAAFAVAQLERDEGAARALLDRAIALNPGCAAVWYMNGLVRVRIGETDLAVEHLETAMRLDPIGPDRPNQIGFMSWARFQQRRFEEAITLGKEFVRLKDHPRGYAFLASSYGHIGDRAAQRAALQQYNALADRSVESFAETFILDPANRALFLEGVR